MLTPTRGAAATAAAPGPSTSALIALSERPKPRRRARAALPGSVRAVPLPPEGRAKPAGLWTVRLGRSNHCLGGRLSGTVAGAAAARRWPARPSRPGLFAPGRGRRAVAGGATHGRTPKNPLPSGRKTGQEPGWKRRSWGRRRPSAVVVCPERRATTEWCHSSSWTWGRLVDLHPVLRCPPRRRAAQGVAARSRFRRGVHNPCMAVALRGRRLRGASLKCGGSHAASSSSLLGSVWKPKLAQMLKGGVIMVHDLIHGRGDPRRRQRMD